MAGNAITDGKASVALLTLLACFIVFGTSAAGPTGASTTSGGSPSVPSTNDSTTGSDGGTGTLCPSTAGYTFDAGYVTPTLSPSGLAEYKSRTSWYRSGSTVANGPRHVIQTSAVATGGWNAPNPNDPVGDFYSSSCRPVTNAPILQLGAGAACPPSAISVTYSNPTRSVSYSYAAMDSALHPNSLEHSHNASSAINGVRPRATTLTLYVTSPGEFGNTCQVATVPLNGSGSTSNGLMQAINANTAYPVELGSTGALTGNSYSLVLKNVKTWHVLEKIYNVYQTTWDAANEMWINDYKFTAYCWTAASSTNYQRIDLTTQKLLCEDAAVDSRKGLGVGNLDGGQMMDANAEAGNYNLSNSQYNGGVFVGNMSSGDSSGAARTQLYPNYPNGGTITSGVTKFATLSAFYLGPRSNGTGDVAVTVSIPAGTDPNFNTAWNLTNWANSWTNRTTYTTLQFPQVNPPAANEYYNWILPLTNANAAKRLCLEMTNTPNGNSWRYFASKEYQASASAFPLSDSQSRVWLLNQTATSSW